jgi:hypothetical protein
VRDDIAKQAPDASSEQSIAKSEIAASSIPNTSRRNADGKKVSFSTYKNTDRNKMSGSGAVVLCEDRVLISGSRIERDSDNKPKPRPDGTIGAVEGNEEILLRDIRDIKIVKANSLLFAPFILLDIIIAIFVIINLDSVLYTMSQNITWLLGGILSLIAIIVIPIAILFMLSNKKHIVRFTNNEGYSSDVFITKKELHDAETLIQMLNRK